MHKKNFIHLLSHLIYIILYLSLIILSIFFYNSANLRILSYVGWLLLISGASILFVSVKSRKKIHKKRTFVKTGIYAYIRHPGYLGHMLIIFSLIFIGQSLINIIIGTILIVLLFLAIIEEEKRNIRKFGYPYKIYMKKVPKINLLAGILKQLSH